MAPFSIHLIPIEKTQKVNKISEKLYSDLQKENVEVLYDDRKDKSVGERFADCDLMGIPIRLVVSEKTLLKNSVEIKNAAKKNQN